MVSIQTKATAVTPHGQHTTKAKSAGQHKKSKAIAVTSDGQHELKLQW